MGCSEIVRYVSRHGGSRVARAVFLAPILPLLVKVADNPDGIEPLPRARLIELPEVGHGLYVTHAPQIVDEAAKFVGSPG
jgi:hypothetical protein